MENAVMMVLVYGAFGLIGIPIGRMFTAIWLLVLTVLLVGIGGYLYYVPGNIFNVAQYPSSPEAGQLSAMLPFLWFGMSTPILAGAWITLLVSKFILRKKSA